MDNTIPDRRRAAEIACDEMETVRTLLKEKDNPGYNINQDPDRFDRFMRVVECKIQIAQFFGAAATAEVWPPGIGAPEPSGEPQVCPNAPTATELRQLFVNAVEWIRNAQRDYGLEDDGTLAELDEALGRGTKGEGDGKN